MLRPSLYLIAFCIAALCVACSSAPPLAPEPLKAASVAPAPASPAAETPPPKDVLSAEWIAYARRHPRGSALEHPSLRDPAITSIAEAHKQADAVRAEINTRLSSDQRWSYTHADMQPLCDKLLDLAATPDDYLTCAQLIQSYPPDSQSRQDALIPYLKAALIDSPAQGPIYAELAAAYSWSERPDEAMQAIEAAVDHGFNAFAWINTSYDLASMREHDSWPALRERLLPKELAYDTLNIAGNIHEEMGRDSQSYTLCANGRYSIEDHEFGFWSIEDGALKLSAASTCTWEWDEHSDESHRVCTPPSEPTTTTLLTRDDLVLAFTNAPLTDENGNERYLDYGFEPHPPNQEPELCTQPQPWDTRPQNPPKPDIDPNTVSTLLP